MQIDLMTVEIKRVFAFKSSRKFIHTHSKKHIVINVSKKEEMQRNLDNFYVEEVIIIDVRFSC